MNFGQQVNQALFDVVGGLASWIGLDHTFKKWAEDGTEDEKESILKDLAKIKNQNTDNITKYDNMIQTLTNHGWSYPSSSLAKINQTRDRLIAKRDKLSSDQALRNELADNIADRVTNSNHSLGDLMSGRAWKDINRYKKQVQDLKGDINNNVQKEQQYEQTSISQEERV